MAPDADDVALLDSISHSTLTEFRNQMFTLFYIQNHPAKFVETDWVDFEALREFLKGKEAPLSRVKRDPDASSRDSERVKKERDASPELSIKQEPGDNLSSSTGLFGTHARTRTLYENGTDVIEILDTSDEEDSDAMDTSEGTRKLPEANDGMSSDTLFDGGAASSFDDSDDSDSNSEMTSGIEEINSSDYAFSDDEAEAADSHTVWLDPTISSTVQYGKFCITRQYTATAFETVTGLPSYWPVPRDKRAFLLDLSDPKYDVYDKNGKLMAVDAIIKNNDQDSWKGSSGGGQNDSKPHLPILGKGHGKGVLCRRSRLSCAGFYACELVQPELLDIRRHELDPQSLEKVVHAQVESRLTEADSTEKAAIIFYTVVRVGSCVAENENGDICDGVPVMRAFKEGRTKNGKHHFIACSGRTLDWKEGHRTWNIPSGVREEDLEILMSGKNLPGFDEPLRCSRIIPAHVGGRVKKCKYPHNGNGKQAYLKRHECDAYKTIFIPLDTSIRKAIIIFEHEKPHNHPVLPATKASISVKNLYRDCIAAAGLVGSSVGKVDNGVQHLMDQDMKLPVEKRYVHGICTSESDGSVVITANAYLLSRIHHAASIYVDTTFKRTDGAMNEWELVIWDKMAQCAMSIARVYSNRSDTPQYKKIFDEVQRVTLKVTGHPLRLKRLTPGGTLITIGVDLELAQVLGACESFFHTNNSGYSNIHVEHAHELAPYFVRGCYAHGKRGIHDLKPYISTEEYEHIMEFFYLDSEAKVEEFKEWVRGLKNPKVQAWWDHKVNNKWILPSLIKCLSKIDGKDWDLTQPTTNIGEAAHHWTNTNTGIGLSLVEAIESARECDERVAAEVQASFTTGVFKNPRNDAYTRMQRSTTRNTNSFNKAREAKAKDKKIVAVDEQIEVLTKGGKENREMLKVLKAEKKNLRTGVNRRAGASKAESSSSGKVMVTGNTKQARAKTAAKSRKKVHTERAPAKSELSAAHNLYELQVPVPVVTTLTSTAMAEWPLAAPPGTSDPDFSNFSIDNTMLSLPDAELGPLCPQESFGYARQEMAYSTTEPPCNSEMVNLNAQYPMVNNSFNSFNFDTIDFDAVMTDLPEIDPTVWEGPDGLWNMLDNTC